MTPPDTACRVEMKNGLILELAMSSSRVKYLRRNKAELQIEMDGKRMMLDTTKIKKISAI